MSRRRDIALWHEVNRNIIGLTGVVEMFAKRVRRADRLELAREMIKHGDELAARADRSTEQLAVARLEGEAKGWRGAAATFERVALERRTSDSPRCWESPGAVLSPH